MKGFPDNVSSLFPVLLEPCLSGENVTSDPMIVQLEEPDNLSFCQLIAPLASQFQHCGVCRHNGGYDCDVVLLPLPLLISHLKSLRQKEVQDPPLIPYLLKPLVRWQKSTRADFVRLQLPRRYRNFGFEQQIWGHENDLPPPTLHNRARKLARDHCVCCGHVSHRNTLIFHDSDPENLCDDNLRVACAICAYNYRLNRLSADDGVMVYLPEFAPADVSLLMRAIVQAKQHGDARQKKGAASAMRWLTEHRKEVETFWGTSHPGEFGQALMQSSPRMREDLQQRLRHIALIPNPRLLSRHIGPAAYLPVAWPALLKQYRSQG